MITKAEFSDLRFPLGPGAGSDAIHRDPIYSYATTLLHDDSGLTGTGLAFTRGEGNDLVCKAAAFLARTLEGCDIETLTADFGAWQRSASNEQQFLRLPRLWERVPHLQGNFAKPCEVENGHYAIPQDAGMSSDFIQNSCSSTRSFLP